MQPQRLVELGNHRWRQLCDARSEASDVNGSDLLCLCFGRACQPGGTGCSIVWKGSTCVTLDVTGTTVTTPRPRIVARSFAPSLLTIYNGPPPIGLRAAYRLKVGKANLALSHEHGSASAAVGSHKSASPDFSHSCQASSYASPSWDTRNNPIARWTAAERDSMLSCHGRRGSR
jgi:hypothetical protein